MEIFQFVIDKFLGNSGQSCKYLTAVNYECNETSCRDPILDLPQNSVFALETSQFVTSVNYGLKLLKLLAKGAFAIISNGRNLHKSQHDLAIATIFDKAVNYTSKMFIKLAP